MAAGAAPFRCSLLFRFVAEEHFFSGKISKLNRGPCIKEAGVGGSVGGGRPEINWSLLTLPTQPVSCGEQPDQLGHHGYSHRPRQHSRLAIGSLDHDIKQQQKADLESKTQNKA